jgi:hypothetical protein
LRRSVQPAGGVTVAVFGRTPTAAIITSSCTVPAGLVMVSVVVADPAEAAARKAMAFAPLNVVSLRASVHRITAFGVWPRPCGITCAAGAADVLLMKLPTSNPITAALMSTPDEVQATALPAVQAWVTVAAPAAVEPPALMFARAVSSHDCVLVGADRNGDVTDSVPTVLNVMSPGALVIVTAGVVDAPIAVVPLMIGVS